MSGTDFNTNMMAKAAAVLIAFVFAACAFSGTLAEGSSENSENFSVTIKVVGNGSFTVDEDETEYTEKTLEFGNGAECLNYFIDWGDAGIISDVITIESHAAVSFEGDLIESKTITPVADSGEKFLRWRTDKGFVPLLGWKSVQKNMTLEAIFISEETDSITDLQNLVDESGDTLTLNKNYEMRQYGEEEPITTDPALVIDKDLTIDVGDNYIIFGLVTSDFESDKSIKIIDGATLTIRGNEGGLIFNGGLMILIDDGSLVLESGNLCPLSDDPEGRIFVGEKGKFIMNGGCVSGFYSPQTVNVMGEVIVNGGTFSSGHVCTLFYTEDGGKLTINDVTIDGACGDNVDYGCLHNGPGELKFNGGTVKNCLLGDGIFISSPQAVIGNIVATNNIVDNFFAFSGNESNGCKIDGAKISENDINYLMWFDDNCSAEISGGLISDNSLLSLVGSNESWGIHGKLTLSGGTVCENVFNEQIIDGNTVFTMTGGVIKNNVSMGSAISLIDGIMRLLGGTIENNVSVNDTFFVDASKTIELGGTIVIRDNFIGEYNEETGEFSNLVLNNLRPGQGSVSSDVPFEDGASVFVTDGGTTDPIMENAPSGSEWYFHLETPGKVVVNVDGDLYAADAFGECGDGVAWEIDGDRIVVSGDGVMNDYPEGESPWSAFGKSVNEIVIGKDVRSIGENAFFGCSNVRHVVFEGNRPAMGKHCFALGTEDDPAVFTAETPGWDPAQVFSLEYYVGSYSLFVKEEKKEVGMNVLIPVVALAAISLAIMGVFAFRRK